MQLTCAKNIDPRSQQILDTLVPLIARFPEFPTANALYNRNFVSTIDQCIEKIEHHKNLTHSLSVGDTASFSIQFVENSDSNYDSKRLLELHETFDDCFTKLKPYLVKLENIQKDLQVLKSKSNNFSGLAKKLIRCSPLIYDQYGNAINSQIADNFSEFNLSPVELQALYVDHFQVHLLPIITLSKNIPGLGEIEKISKNTLNQFIPKVVIPATRLYASNKTSIRNRSLTLEEVPPIYTPLRGAVAKDCSMVTVPFYGLLKSTRVFWIFNDKSIDNVPIGYVFMVEVDLDGEIFPYIITINGPMVTTAQCHAIYLLIANVYQKDFIYIADWKNVQYLVNYAPIRDSVVLSKTQSTQLPLPSGWKIINEDNFGMDCYTQEVAGVGLKIDVKHIPGKVVSINEFAPEKKYPTYSNYLTLPIITRTILVYFFQNASRHDSSLEDNLEPIKLYLGVSDIHMENIQLFFDMYRYQQFSVDSFLALYQCFSFRAKELQSLDPIVRAPVLSPLYEKHSELFSHQDWKQLCGVTFRQLEGRLQDTTLSSGSRDSIRDHIAAIPYELVDNYWQVVSRFLFVENTQSPDYYALQRLVKYLKSPSAVQNMLQFLNDNSEFVDFVQANNRRWFDFFKQASPSQKNEPYYLRVVEKVFYEKSINRSANLAIYEMAKLFVYGCELGFTQKEEWFNRICSAQQYQGRSLDEFNNRIELEFSCVHDSNH